MYGLDVNFLNDRPEYKPDVAARSRPKAAMPANSRTPLILGGLIALLLPALVGGFWWFLQTQNAQLEQQQAELDSKLGNLEAKRKEIENTQNQTKQVKDEATALAGVFNQIKPWSAMMQDIRDRIPPGVQVSTVKQLPPDAAAAAAAAQPPQPGTAPPAAAPIGYIAISGVANSFNDVNDFMLVLQKSNFLKAKETNLVKAELEATARKLEQITLKNVPSTGTQDQPEMPRQVQFTIQTALSDVPASELLRELDRKGAAGLVTRIETLQQKGVIQQ